MINMLLIITYLFCYSLSSIDADGSQSSPKLLPT